MNKTKVIIAGGGFAGLYAAMQQGFKSISFGT
jgi:thioredoxin reductase